MLLTQPHVRLRKFQNIFTIACLKHATLYETESIPTLSTMSVFCFNDINSIKLLFEFMKFSK